MNFTDAIRSGFSKYAVFSGRASRSEFWLFYLFYMLVGIAAGVLDCALFPRDVNQQPFAGIVSLVFFLPLLTVTARRLHDVDRSGWWMLLPMPFVLLAGAFGAIGVFRPATPEIIIVGVLIVLVLATMILLIVWYCTKGTAGPNRFGADPRAGAIA